MAKEEYFYGQGRVFLAPIIAGILGMWRWIGDVSSLKLALEIEHVEHKESYSGQKALARSFPIGKTATLTAILHSLEIDNLALTLFGKSLSTPGSTVTGEVLPNNMKAGDIAMLAHQGVSNVAITDSAGGAATLDPKHYNVSPHGTFELLSLPVPPPTQPFKAAYTYAATKAVGMFTAPQPLVALRYDGINLAENGAPVVFELYRVGTDPLKELPFVTDGNSVAGMEISGGVLIDPTKPANGDMGQFGRIIQVGA